MTKEKNKLLRYTVKKIGSEPAGKHTTGVVCGYVPQYLFIYLLSLFIIDAKIHTDFGTDKPHNEHAPPLWCFPGMP